VSLVALECDRANGSYRAKRCRGRKFCPAGNFEVSIPYSAADTKNSKDGGRKKATAGEHACAVGSTVDWFDGPTCRPGNRHVGRDESKAVGFLTWADGFAMFPQISNCLHSRPYRSNSQLSSSSSSISRPPRLAKQGGTYAARAIRAALASRPAPPPFRYRHYGSLATIGRQAAVADFGGVRVRGAPAWWLWGAAHIAFLIGVRNRFTVLATWLWAYLTFRRGSCLITSAGL
jgi:hypothetical protein